MKLKRCHGCCSAMPSPSSSPSPFPAPSSCGTASSCCCRRQRVGNVVGQFVGNFKRPTNCSKICHNVVHDSGANARALLQVSTLHTPTTTILTTKSHNNSDSSETRCAATVLSYSARELDKLFGCCM